MSNIKLNKSVLHEVQKRDGFFDGRFKTRSIKNKKREGRHNIGDRSKNEK